MSDTKDWADMDKAVAESESKYEAIMTLLEQHPDGLSVHRINELLNRAGLRTTSDGQVLNRLKTLERRERVERVEGEHGTLWVAVGAGV